MRLTTQVCPASFTLASPAEAIYAAKPTSICLYVVVNNQRNFSGASGKWRQPFAQSGVHDGGKAERRPVDDASGSRFACGRGRGPGAHDALADVGCGLGMPGPDCPARG